MIAHTATLIAGAISPVIPASTRAPESNLPDPELVTPGTVGFLVTFLLAVVVVLLAKSLLRRQRRMRARAGVVTRHAIPIERETAAQQRAAEARSGERTEAGGQSAGAESAAGAGADVADADDASADETSSADGEARA